MIEWYSYGVFRWTPEQVFWALQHREEMLTDWPKEPDEYVTDEYVPDEDDEKKGEWIKVMRKSSYIDVQGQRPFNIEARHIKPRNVMGEINKRLETVSRDPKEALLDEVGIVTDYTGLCRPAMRALNYISGWQSKKRPFWKWSYDWRQEADKYPVGNS